jgi:predicted aspartyl protease
LDYKDHGDYMRRFLNADNHNQRPAAARIAKGFGWPARRPPGNKHGPPSWLWGVFAIASIGVIVASDWPQLRSLVDHFSVSAIGPYANDSRPPDQPAVAQAAPPVPVPAPSVPAPAAHAHALDLDCGPATVFVGKQGSIPVTSTRISHGQNGWSIQHVLSNAQIVSRGEQYDMADATAERRVKAPDSLGFWSGYLKSNDNLYMVGEVYLENGYRYEEWLLDLAHNHALVLHSQALCQPTGTTVVASAPRSAQPTIPIRPRPNPYDPSDPIYSTHCEYNSRNENDCSGRVAPAAPSMAPTDSRDSVPIYPSDNYAGAQVDVMVGSQPVRLTVDTGANISSVSERIAETIVRDGEGDWLPPNDFVLADGTTKKQSMVRIRELRIGKHVLHDVVASVTRDDSVMLLGFSTINRIGPFTINTRTHELIFDSALGASDSTPAPTPDAAMTCEQLSDAFDAAGDVMDQEKKKPGITAAFTAAALAGERIGRQMLAQNCPLKNRAGFEEGLNTLHLLNQLPH